MDKFDRIFQLHAILASRRTPISLEQLMAKLECSKSTVLRAIDTMKNHLRAPIEFSRDAGGYQYGKPEGGHAYELPGLWFSANELQALAVMRRLLKDVAEGRELGDATTLRDPAIVESIKDQADQQLGR